MDQQRVVVAMPARMAQGWRVVVAVALALGVVALFVGRQPESAPQWQRELWNLGHVALFAGLAWALLQRWRAPLHRQLPRLLLGTALVGYAVELIQRQIGRDFSLRDVALDMVGSAVGGWLAVRARLSPRQHQLLALPLLAALAAAVLPVVAIGWDSLQAVRQFPRLATFTSPLELRRFQLYGGTRGEIRDGALQLQFGTAEWSGFTLTEPAADWRGYRALRLELVNPASTPLVLSCRIDDTLHRRNGFDFHDRFNRRFTLASGSNLLRIALRDIERAPRDRRMAMDRIDSLGCFVHRQSGSRPLQLRALTLE